MIRTFLVLQQQQNLGRRFGTSKMHLSPPPPPPPPPPRWLRLLSVLGGGSVVVDCLFIVTPIVGVCNCSLFCCTLLYVPSRFAIILMGKRELIALLNLSSWCLVKVEQLFLTVPQGCLQFVIVVFPDHNHLLFFARLHWRLPKLLHFLFCCEHSMRFRYQGNNSELPV